MSQPKWKQPPSDFTVFLDRSVLETLLAGNRTPAQGVDRSEPPSTGPAGRNTQPRPNANPRRMSFDQAVYFAWPLELAGKHRLIGESGDQPRQLVVIYRARCLACPCFNRQLCSITLRRDDESPPRTALLTGADSFSAVALEFAGERESVSEWRANESGAIPALDSYIGLLTPQLVLAGEWAYFPRGPRVHETSAASPPEPAPPPNPYLFTCEHIVRVLFPAIFHPDSEATPDLSRKVIRHGLVVISGQTGTLKSTIVRGLLDRYLRCFNYRAWGKQRYPHVVTLEDPIEQPIVPFDAGRLQEYFGHARARGIDFTPRQIGDDVESLQDGLNDALRQTPAAVLVGETRDRKDWRKLLRFASTGHLCFTTTHAGSLVETMRTIIEATGSTTPDLRSSLAEKITAVVHLRNFDLSQPTPGRETEDIPEFENKKSMLLPAIWRNVNGGANFFVSDGLSAILPRRAEGKNDRLPANCRGRSDLARDLIRHLSAPGAGFCGHVVRIATRSDLEGV